MGLRRLAVLVLTLASVTLPAAPLTGADTSAPALAAGITGHIGDPVDLTPAKVEPGPGGPTTCCTFG